MGIKDTLRNVDTDLNLTLPGIDALIYEEVQSGTSWYTAGILFGLDGTREAVGARARRMAGTHARNYRHPWPLVEVDELSAAEAAQEAALLARTASFSTGKLLYEERLRTSDWASIARKVGFPRRRSKAEAQAYALAHDLPWPILDERHDCGEVAYNRRVEKKEPWPVIAAAIHRATDHTRKAAHGYALRTGNPWPVILKDYGPEAYRLRYVEGLSWEDVAARCHISRSWAIREADRHKASLATPLPSPSATLDIDARTYELRAQGKGWKEVRSNLKCSASVAVERARRHAHATGKPWPIPLPPVRTTHSPRAQAAYERGYAAGEPWDKVAAELGYASVESAKTSARCYADRCGLALDIRRRRTLNRNNERPRLAYEGKMQSPEVSWAVIGTRLGYPSVQSAHTAARSWARKRGLPWPLPGDSDG